MARKMGLELMPWQRHVLDVGLEINPETGRLAYRQVMVTLPRQNGKSQMLLILMIARCVAYAQQQGIIYTAQDGNSAQRKFEEDYVRQLRNTAGLVERKDFTARLSNGKERILWNQNGSIIRPMATTETSGHGLTLDLVIIDEAFAHKDLRVEQNFAPPMLTRPEPQIWIVSTAGTWESLYYNAKRAAGRKAVEAGETTRTAYFEWSAEPDDDLWDRDVWRRIHPALGLTITEESLAFSIQQILDDPEQGEAEARRAYLNQTREKRETESIIDRDAWLAQIDEGSRIAPTAQAALAVDMPPDRSRVAVAVAGWREDKAIHLGLVHDTSRDDREVLAGPYRGSLVDWMVDRVVDLFNLRREKGAAFGGVAIDPSSPAGSMISALEARGIPVIKMGAQKHAQACGAFMDRLTDRTIWHLGQPELAVAAADAKQRVLGDAWAWDRKSRKGYIAPLVAGTLAVGALLGLPEPEDLSSVYDDGGLLDLNDY